MDIFKMIIKGIKTFFDPKVYFVFMLVSSLLLFSNKLPLYLKEIFGLDNFLKHYNPWIFVILLFSLSVFFLEFSYAIFDYFLEKKSRNKLLNNDECFYILKRLYEEDGGILELPIDNISVMRLQDSGMIQQIFPFANVETSLYSSGISITRPYRLTPVAKKYIKKSLAKERL